MSMKKAFDSYFEALNDYWKKKDGGYPKTYYKEKYDVENGIYVVDTLDEKGYVRWQPRIQKEEYNFEVLEEKLGIKIHSSIKEFYSLYWFDDIEGAHEIGEMWLNGVLPGMDIFSKIEKGYDKGKNHFRQGDIFYCIGLSDSYTIMINNKSGEVIAVIFYEEEEVHLADSLEELLYFFVEELRRGNE